MVRDNKKENKIFDSRGEFFEENWVSLTPLGPREYRNDGYLRECFEIVYGREPTVDEIRAIEQSDDLRTSLINRANLKVQRDSMR
ncbi:MAG: hypothetical protein RXP30_07155 [Thermoplasmata archaeon]|jgi:hypothetical protein|nr:hypothetical protein [Euryarchaeota archaeon]MVT14992.1 hypothetical protein [Euryarchaeota archaeon]MVT36470.1 hypothetical protein [Euryarchaeota archaeon]